MADAGLKIAHLGLGGDVDDQEVTGSGVDVAAIIGVRDHCFATKDSEIGIAVFQESDGNEYAMHAVRASRGGCTEIFRLGHSDLPHKHFFDHSPRANGEGDVAGKLVITHVGNVRIVECSMSWSELPLVQARMKAGESAKFTFRINDDAGVDCLELSRGRSVSCMNAKALKPDWTVPWANEVEFGWER